MYLRQDHEHHNRSRKCYLKDRVNSHILILFICLLIFWNDIFEEFLDNLPKNQRRRLVLERNTPSVSLLVRRVLEMRSPEIGMIFVLVPASMKSCVWVDIVYAKPIVWPLAIPLDNQFRRLRSRHRLEMKGIEGRGQLLRFDIVRDVLDTRDMGGHAQGRHA